MLDLPDHYRWDFCSSSCLTSSGFRWVMADPREVGGCGAPSSTMGGRFSKKPNWSPKKASWNPSTFPLAPLHNPANYLGIEVQSRFLKSCKASSCFITANFTNPWSQSLTRMAIPMNFMKSQGIRGIRLSWNESQNFVSEIAGDT